MGFSVFREGSCPTVEETLADNTFRRLLFSLLTEHMFLSAGQARRYLLLSAPTGTSCRLVTNDNVRSILDQLVDAEYLGCRSALVPPFTIADQPIIFREGGYHNCQRLSPAEAKNCAELARRRVPPLDRHETKKLYFARGTLGPYFRALGYSVDYWNESDWRRGKDELFGKVFGEHHEVEERHGVTPYEIACTDLTAQYNLNQVRFLNRVHPANSANMCGFHFHASVNPQRLDAELTNTELGWIGLYFLRPWQAHQFIEQIDEYRVWYSQWLSTTWWL